MTATITTRRAVALVLGLVLLAQCLLAPLALARIDRAAVVALGAAATAAALLWSVPRVARAEPRATGFALAGVPALLALTSLVASTLPRFDGAARVLAACTAVGYFAAVLSLREAAAPRIALAARSTSTARPSQPPPLRWVAWAVLVGGAVALALVVPAKLATRPLAGSERALGPAFVGARNAVVSASGLLLALLWTLGAGPRLVRGKGSPFGRRARAIAMIVWAFAFGALWWWVERAR